MGSHTTREIQDESKASKKDKRYWEYKKLGFSKPDTAEIVNSLNQLLANYQIHYQKLRNYHWNVVGPDFFDLHEKFEEQYNEAIENIDDIAERIRVFGYTPMSSLKEYLANSEIKETGSNLSGMEMVSEILKDFEILLSYMVNVADAAIDTGDVGTEDMINSFIKKMEKSHWMFTAFATKK
ncbi:Non-specific DNA-binding protein Dps [Fulvivirga imtechensis AK7]|uniref:Non-specific DNA-binding protein Dps n=1 Tax=Fulvivirga imtechensis AK7 TaxID=1237149 RepID=L8JJD5_9BACT|nr:DNA starvation/stationary phase protection protein [Fulvivirga imtechensis]ELR68348.1 Non-specific DNA-binding protein Dps [Fulvivirga imtechensis AK7]